MRTISVALAVSLLGNVALGIALLVRPADPGLVGGPDDETAASGRESLPPVPLARAAEPDKGRLPSDAAAADAPPVRPQAAPPDVLAVAEKTLRRPATEAERSELARFVAASATAAPVDFALSILAKERAELEQIERSRIAVEDAKRGGPLAFLERVKNGDAKGPVFDFVGGKEFERWFDAETKGMAHSLLVGGPVPDQIGDGDILAFAPGVHRFSVQRWSRKRFPRDLTFQGSGRDQTLVTLDEFDDAEGPIVNLTFRDMTVDCGDDYLFDVRREQGVTARMERCRLVRYDMGAGGSVAFGCRSLAAWLSDCSIETGYGRSPPSGNLFRCSELVARIEDSRVVGSSLGDASRGTVLVRRCTLDPSPPRDSLVRSPILRLVDSNVRSDDFEAWASEHRRAAPLSSINAEWVGIR